MVRLFRTLFFALCILQASTVTCHIDFITNRFTSISFSRSFDNPTRARLAYIMNEIVKSKNTNRSSGVSKSSMQADPSIFDKTRLKRIRSCVPYNR